MSLTQVSDFPQVWGNRLVDIFVVNGPASYTQIVTGTPVTGGHTINASDFGFKFITWAQSMGADNGQYDVTCYPTLSDKTDMKTMQVQWVTSATGAEVAATTNLSARSLRMIVVGR